MGKTVEAHPLTHATIFLALLGYTVGQFISPCPRLFSYEPQKENDRWYAIITLKSESDLNGVWLRLVFDRPALQVGNWFGETQTQDNKEYLIKNPKHKISANMPFALRFYVRYNPAEPAPQLLAFRLNAKTVCPEGADVTTPENSVDIEFTSNPLAAPVGGVSSTPPTSFVQPTVPNRNPGNPQEAIACGTVAKQTIRGKRQTGYNPDYRYWNHNHHHHHHDNGPWVTPKTLGIENRAPGEVEATPLITYGQATNEGEFPWHVALYQERGADLQYSCGGSLVADNYVLTVAHCVTQQRTENVLDVERLLVYLGKYYLKKWSNPGIQSSQVDALIPHPDYSAQSYANDIALIKLKKPVLYTDYVRPICIWEGDTTLAPILEKTGTVAGWGLDENAKITERLMQAKMPVVSKETCIYSFPNFFSRFTTAKTYCAGFRNGTSACSGDSGGGMIFPKPSSDPKYPVWQLRGLVSVSVARHNDFRCDSSHYVVFTDVAQYLEWIYSTMKK